MRADLFQQQKGDVLTPIRKIYKGTLVSNMGYDAKEANEAIAAGKIDAVAFGTSFLANPDLPERIRTNAALNEPDPATFYSPGPKGYTDYPALH
jgi:N-ethylmaleimide reductase